MPESKKNSTAKQADSAKKSVAKSVKIVVVKKATVAKKVSAKKPAAKKASVAKKPSAAKKPTVAKKPATKKAAPAVKSEKKTATAVKATEKTSTSVKNIDKSSPEVSLKEAANKSQATGVTNLPEIDLQEMFEAGCHFGHNIAKWHPKMAPYIYGSEGGSHIFDLEKTAEQLDIACQRFYDLAKEGKSLLMIGTKRSAREIVKEAATEMGCFYIVSRWMGGLLTNFTQLQKSILRMSDIETGLESGKFDKYTKYERLQLDKEKTRLERFFIGLKGLKGKPDCIFVIDPEQEKIVVKEASSEGVELIAIADSNADPRKINIIIPANDDTSKSVQYIVQRLKNAYNAGKVASK